MGRNELIVMDAVMPLKILPGADLNWKPVRAILDDHSTGVT